VSGKTIEVARWVLDVTSLIPSKHRLLSDQKHWIQRMESGCYRLIVVLVRIPLRLPLPDHSPSTLCSTLFGLAPTSSRKAQRTPEKGERYVEKGEKHVRKKVGNTSEKGGYHSASLFAGFTCRCLVKGLFPCGVSSVALDIATCQIQRPLSP